MQLKLKSLFGNLKSASGRLCSDDVSRKFLDEKSLKCAHGKWQYRGKEAVGAAARYVCRHKGTMRRKPQD